MWLGLQTGSSLERCPLFRVSFMERSHCMHACVHMYICGSCRCTCSCLTHTTAHAYYTLHTHACFVQLICFYLQYMHLCGTLSDLCIVSTVQYSLYTRLYIQLHTVLYCTVLYCTVLYCTLLYFTVLYRTVPYCTVLYRTVLYCTVLYCTVLYCTVLYCV